MDQRKRICEVEDERTVCMHMHNHVMYEQKDNSRKYIKHTVDLKGRKRVRVNRGRHTHHCQHVGRKVGR